VETALLSQERLDHLVVLLLLQAAGAVDQRTAGLSSGISPRRMANCSRCIRAKSSGRKRQRTSTRRRITPVFVQGASRRILSKE
jgi:hypothetical protein